MAGTYSPHRDAPVVDLERLCVCKDDRAMHIAGGACDLKAICGCERFRCVLSDCGCEHCTERRSQ